jgi:hypothetical protein
MGCTSSKEDLGAYFLCILILFGDGVKIVSAFLFAFFVLCATLRVYSSIELVVIEPLSSLHNVSEEVREKEERNGKKI